MRRIELKAYNGQFDDHYVIYRIHRKIARCAQLGECVLVDGEDVIDLSASALQVIFSGLSADKVRPIGFPSLRPFPLPVSKVQTSSSTGVL